MLVRVVTGERRGDLLFAGLDAVMRQAGQGIGIALTADNRPQYLHPGHSADVAEHHV